VATFDAGGVTWVVALDLGAINDVRNETKKHLGKSDMSDLNEVLADPFLLIDVLCVLCRSQMQKAGMDKDAFMRLFAGDLIETAQVALMTAYADFCPARVRPAMLNLIEKSSQYATRAGERAIAAVESLDLEALLKTS
jgi:hypothetical protein